MGEEVVVGSPQWESLQPAFPVVLEVCLQGSSLGTGIEAWFAVLATEATGKVEEGFTFIGTLLGSEDEALKEEIVSILHDGGVHLCREDPCPSVEVPYLIHATRVRFWPVERFEATYLIPEGPRMLSQAARQKAAKEKAEAKKVDELAKRTVKDAGKSAAQPARRKAASAVPSQGIKRKRTPGVVEISDEDGNIDGEPMDEDYGQAQVPVGQDPVALRAMLDNTKARILRGKGEANLTKGVLSGGRTARSTRPAVPGDGLISGAALNPQSASMLPLVEAGASNDPTMPSWMEKMAKKKSCDAQLLAQAVQTMSQEKNRKRKDKGKDLAEALVNILKGKNKKKKKKKKHKGLAAHLKPDPGDPHGSDDGSDGDESSSDEEDQGGRAEDSDSSCEAPLRRKANKRPGSVMEMLIRHAQEQLDQGALLDADRSQAALTQGIKITTYFALLVRPYHAGTSPLMRELFSLANCIDLLRSGRLPQAGDALAARFMACHLALSEGNWSTASQLELYPLEPTQAASQATMLQAQRHKKLVWKSQGYQPTWNWTYGGRGKGGYQNERGKKGDPKGKGKNRNKGKNRDGSGGQGTKGESNPWEKNREEAPKK